MKKIRYIGNILLHNKFALFSCFFGVILISCNYVQPLEERYGAKYNEERGKIGLIPLNSQWLFSHKENDMIFWNPKNLDSLKNCSNAYYGQKRMRFKTDTLIFEADEFVGPKPFSEKGEFGELSYIYYFTPYEMRSIGWEYFIMWQIGEDEKGMIVSSKDITKNEADSILHSWGLKYQ